MKLSFVLCALVFVSMITPMASVAVAGAARGGESMPGAADNGEEEAALVYVNRANQSGFFDGLSWSTAFPTIQPALDLAQSLGGGEVWVAGGRYGETRPGGGTLLLRPGVALYGGFAGAETARGDRDWVLNQTIIDGATSNNGLPTAAVVRGADDAVLDGFVITGGRGVFGGGMVNDGVSPRIERCIFRNNRVTQSGGGMLNTNGAAPLIVNSVFWNNRSDIHGGAMTNNSSSPTLIGCTLSGNFAPFRGAGIYNFTDSSPVLVNCIVWGNAPEEIGNTGTSQPSITYTLISVLTPGIGNVFADPLFRNPAIGNFNLRAGSPAIDHGRDTGSEPFFNVVEDFAGNLRGFDGDGLGLATADGSDFDMGALEYLGDAELVFHSADTNQDFAIDLSELLRVVQFYNSNGYRCAFGTEDGFAPGLADQPGCQPHDSDFAPADFRINVTELLRLIQYFNASGGYAADPSSEDGFRPVFLSGV